MKKKAKDILREHVYQHEYLVNPEEIFLGSLKQIKKERNEKKRYLFLLFLFFGLSIFIKFQVSTLDTNLSSYDQRSDQTALTTDIDQSDVVLNSSEKNTLTQEKKSSELNSENDEIGLAAAAEKSTLLKENSKEIISLELSSFGSTFSNKPLAKVGKLSAEKENINPLDYSDAQLIGKPSNNPLDAFSYLRKANISKNNIAETQSSNNQIESAIAKVGVTYFQKIAAIESSNFDIEARAIPLENALNFNLSTEVGQKNRSKFALSISASYGLFKEDLVANEMAFQNYATLKSAQERELEVLSSKVLLTYMFSNQLLLSVGAKYQQINEEFSWIGSYFVNEHGEVIDVGEDNLEEIGFYQEVDRELVDFNKHQVLSVPILLGFQKNINRFSVGVNAGPSFLLFSSSNGHNLGLAALPVTLDMLNPKFGMGWEGNFDFAYLVAYRTSIFSELSVQRLHAQEQFVSSNINSLSVSLGLRKWL